MATKKPRITITLEPHVYATLKRMSELGGQPMASIVSELLGTVRDPLMRTVAFLEAAAEAPKQVKEGLRKSFEDVERDLYAAAGHTVDQMDWLIEQLMKGDTGAATEPATARTGGASRRASDGVNPHIVIRGSGSTRSGGKKLGRP